MGDFRPNGGGRGGGFGGGRRGGGRGGFGGGRDRRPITMHKAICDQCKKSCEVPFRPTGGKPIYCNDCFGGKRDGGNDRGGDRFARRSSDDYRAPARPDFGGDSGRGNNDELKKQLEMLNIKMDRLVKAIEGMTSSKSFAKEETAKEVVKTTPTIKAKKVVKKIKK